MMAADQAVPQPTTRPGVRRRERNLSLADADRYLLALRWATLGAALLLAPFAGTPAASLDAVFAAVFAVNLVATFYSIRWRPFAAGRPAAILAVDALQAAGTTLLGGGAHSPFFPLFLLLVAELALAVPARMAAAWVMTAGALHVAAVVVSQTGAWTGPSAYMAVGKLFVLLIVGALAVAFAEQVRREEQHRRLAEQHAMQLTTLNELFFALNQPRTELSDALRALLDGSQRLLAADVGMVFLCDPTLGCWKMSAALDGYETVGSEIELADWGWRIAADETYAAGPAYGRPLPPGWPDADTQAVAGIRLATPTGDEPGALVVGRGAGVLDDAEWLTLRALAREAELSLRNAQLHADELAQLAQLRQFEEARRSFFSAVAHELRTPLTVLKTLLPSLDQWRRMSARQRDDVRDLTVQNLERLETLIREFLESSEVEAGAVTLHREPLDLAGRARRVAAGLAPLFESRRQRVTVVADDGLPAVDADRRRVDQVISSLLHNAYKFGAAGGEVREVLTADGASVRLCVEDDGPGVPAEAQAHVFEKFYSLPGQSSIAGVGLGLYISRELVSLHGGRLWYEPRPGGGSRFCLTLPAAAEGPDGDGDAQDPGH